MTHELRQRIIQNNTHFQKTQNNIKWSLSGPALTTRQGASLSLVWAASALLAVAAGSVAAISLSSLSASASAASGALLGVGRPAKVSMTSAGDGSATSAGKGSMSAACLCSSFSAGSALLSLVGSSSGSASAGKRVCCWAKSWLLLESDGFDLSARTRWKGDAWSGEAVASTLVLFVGAAGLDVLDNNWSCLQGLAKISSSGLMSLPRLIGLALAAGTFCSETKNTSSSSSSSDSGAFAWHSSESDLAHEHISWPFTLTKRFVNDELDCVNRWH